MVGGLQPPPLEEEQQATALSGKGVIFVLESANLEVAKVGKVRGGAAFLGNFAASPAGGGCVVGKHTQQRSPVNG